MTKEELENYIFDCTVETCIEMNLFKNGNLDDLYTEVKHRLNSELYIRFDRDYVTGYVNITNGYSENGHEIFMYVNEMDIKLIAIKRIRERKLKEMFD